MTKLMPELEKSAKVRARELKRDAIEASVHRVIAAYIANLGGRVVVSGPIQIQIWPENRKFQFTVAVKCAGRKPVRFKP